MFTFFTTVVTVSSFVFGVSFAQKEEQINYVKPESYYEQLINEGKMSPLATVDPVLDSDLAQLSNILEDILSHSWGPDGVPMVYVEQRRPDNAIDVDAGVSAGKRSRYYRRYPWKRQNSRSRTYEADNRYMCQPSREDVFKLLVALHETRSGNGGRFINFCNRRRSAGAIFTNVRFLGRK